MIAFNKACEVEDFADPDLRFALREVYPDRRSHDRSAWEVAMAVRALGRFGALRPEAIVLVLPDADGDVRAHVAPQVKAVYGGPADGAALAFPDATFDAVACRLGAGQGGLSAVTRLAAEVGRVLKPGGVATMTADLRLAGPPGGTGWPAPRAVLSAAELERFAVRASGLQRVDALRTELSAATLTSTRDLGFSTVGGREDPLRTGPYVVAVRDGYAFTSVNLVLRKPW